MGDQAEERLIGIEVSSDKIVVSTTNDFFGLYKVVQILGVVRGITVRSPSLVSGCAGVFRGCCGGNNMIFVDVCEQARHAAFKQMIECAEKLGANGIVGFRYDTNEFMQSNSEVVAYGTAVKIVQIDTSNGINSR